MPGVTDTQALRFGLVADPIDFAMVRNLADDIAAQLDAADLARTKALKRPVAWSQRSSALALPVNTMTSVPFQVEIWDTHAMVDIPTQPSRIVASATAGTGVYMFMMRASADTTGWTRGDLALFKNGALHTQRTLHTPQNFTPMYHSAIINLGVVGDFVSCSIYHEGGGSTNTSEVNLMCWKISES